MRTEKEKMLAQDLYQASDPALLKEVKESRRLTRLFNQTTEEEMVEREDLVRKLFKKTGDIFYIELLSAVIMDRISRWEIIFLLILIVSY